MKHFLPLLMLTGLAFWSCENDDIKIDKTLVGIWDITCNLDYENSDCTGDVTDFGGYRWNDINGNGEIDPDEAEMEPTDVEPSHEAWGKYNEFGQMEVGYDGQANFTEEIGYFSFVVTSGYYFCDAIGGVLSDGNDTCYVNDFTYSVNGDEYCEKYLDEQYCGTFSQTDSNIVIKIQEYENQNDDIFCKVYYISK